jgi:multiple sugar transport system permease protein
VTTETASMPLARERRRTAIRPPRIGLHVFLIVMAILWLAPVIWTLYTSLRPYSETAERGYVSLPETITLDNYTNAWTNGEIPHFFWNSVLITLPAMAITLFFAACVAFVVARLSFRFNLALLIVFLAANLLPPQVVVPPLYRMYLEIPLPTFMSETGKMYDSLWGLIAINVAFQTGFCAFVLSNYMKTIPQSLGDAARVDGAGVVRQFFGIILPLCRPALAALATLQFTWIYNDFLWAIALIQSGDKRPITSALNNLQGVFFTDHNLIAAGAMLAALPTLIVFAVLQRHFISGLTLGASKG